MVFIEDNGAIYDASLEDLWQYLASPEHGSAHAGSARNLRVTSTDGPNALTSAERRLEGRWTAFVSKTSGFPPLCVCSEELEGDFAGTKFVSVYRPEFHVTRVDLFGDVRSPVFPPEEAHRKFLATLQVAYEEDVRGLRAYRERAGRRA